MPRPEVNKGKDVWLDAEVLEKIEELKAELKVDSPNKVLRKIILEGQGPARYDIKIEPGNVLGDETEAWVTILDAVREIKPPSKWREALMWFLFGMMGGIGLGLFLGLH